MRATSVSRRCMRRFLKTHGLYNRVPGTFADARPPARRWGTQVTTQWRRAYYAAELERMDGHKQAAAAHMKRRSCDS